MRSTANEHYVTAFATRLGWMAIIARNNRLVQLVFGYPSKKAALAALDRKRLDGVEEIEADAPLVERLRAYAEGNADNFLDIAIDHSSQTAFQRKVLKICRNIPFGKTMTYGQLAAQAGFPLAARAVGSCMARNRIPLVIPCHRVVPSNGRLGNFSAPGGTQMKQRLLDMEQECIAPPSKSLRRRAVVRE
jgi:methylated-DNA-[protein]-cysteine S-methyltransferase